MSEEEMMAYALSFSGSTSHPTLLVFFSTDVSAQLTLRLLVLLWLHLPPLLHLKSLCVISL